MSNRDLLPSGKADSNSGHRARQDSISGSQNSPVSAASNAYHMSQVSRFISTLLGRQLTSLQAWMTVIGWQCGNASGIFLTGSMFQSMITIYRPANGTMIWQTIVFLLPCLALVILTNIYGGRAIAITQNVLMSVHILALIAIIGMSNFWLPHQSRC